MCYPDHHGIIQNPSHHCLVIINANKATARWKTGVLWALIHLTLNSKERVSLLVQIVVLGSRQSCGLVSEGYTILFSLKLVLQTIF